MADDNYLHSDVTGEIIKSAMKIHSALGPGLLESAYEACLTYELQKTGFKVERQKELGIKYETLEVPSAYRLDLVVNNKVIVELKSVSKLNETHEAQLLTYLRLSKCKVGLLINFYEKWLKNGIKRYVI